MNKQQQKKISEAISKSIAKDLLKFGLNFYKQDVDRLDRDKYAKKAYLSDNEENVFPMVDDLLENITHDALKEYRKLVKQECKK